jgi:hypothetical protein
MSAQTDDPADTAQGSSAASAPSDGSGSGTGGAADSAGIRIGRYEVQGLLGRGGMGAVYRAFDPVLEREVALKVMLAESVHDPERKQRFEREARAVARLSHPAVVTVFDLGYHTDGSPYIVMELLRGRDLLARMRAEPPLSLQEKVAIVIQILEGLGHAHKAGIVHRDIKPANVFLTEDGSARIMDFGLAYFTSSGATSQNIMGTVAYMSPEQVRGDRLDGRSDLFSVGTVLCELLTGRQPFKAETPGATLFKIANKEPEIELPAAPELQRFLPVVRRALARKADERYQAGAEFADAVRACAVGTAPVARVESAPVAPAARPSAAAAPSTLPEKTPAPTPAAAERRPDPSGLFQLLRRVYVGEKTGQLHLAVGAQRKSLRILQGRILNGSSDAAGEHLGDVLVRYGLLGQSDLDRAVTVVLRERKRLGAVLSEMGLLERDALEEATGIHVREILFSALDRADVSFSFEEQAESSIETDLASPQSMGQVILEATRRVFDAELVRRVLGDTGRVLMLSPDPLLRTQRITLTPTDGFVLSRIDGTLSALDVMALIPLPGEDVERSLFSLLCTGIIDYRAKNEARQSSAGESRIRATPRGVPPSSPPSPPQTRPPVLPPSTPQSTPQTTPPSAPPATPPHREPAPPAPHITTPGPAAHQTAPAPTPASAPSSSGLDTAKIRAILEASKQAHRNPFEVLDLEPTMDESEIRRAYSSLVRVLHPDVALDPGLDDLRPLREAAFVQLGQAYETLHSSLARRQAVEKAARARGQSTPQPVQPTAAPAQPTGAPSPSMVPPVAETPAPGRPARSAAETPPAADPPRVLPDAVVSSAQRHFENGKYWDAIQQLEPILPRTEGTTRVNARMLLAQSYLKNPKWTKRAEETLLELLRESPGHVPAHLLLGELYRASGLVARARSAYQKVLALQPDHEAAARTLAEIQSPQEPEPPKPGGLRGIFGKR